MRIKLQRKAAIKLATLLLSLFCISFPWGQILAQDFTHHISAADQNSSFFGDLLKIYMPRRFCMYQEATLIWLHVVSDVVIALAYYSIPIALIYFVRRRRDLAFSWMFICFAMFILACGTTHIFGTLAIWYPLYRLDGIVKLITAIISVVTAVLLWRLIPKAIALPSPGQLHAVNEELEAFSYSVSHDLRAPARHINGFAEMLRRDTTSQLSAKGQRYVNLMADSAIKMGGLIDKLLEFSRIGRYELHRTHVDMNQLVNEVLQEMSGDLVGRNIHWDIGLLPHLSVDRTILKQVWVNLLSNAVKYSRGRHPAEIKIRCHKNDRAEYEFIVQDNGAGFDMRLADKLFGPFQRLHTQEEFEGIGIGLACVQRFVMRHGGKTWAEGVVNQGATFHFTLSAA